MRFMMIMLPGEGAYDGTGIDDAAAVAELSRYNRELRKAGVLLSADGLATPVEGARVTFRGGKPTVTDGPFAEAKEVIGGYWVLQCRSREEAVQWASRCPAAPDDTIEVRRVFELSDFPQEVREAVAPMYE